MDQWLRAYTFQFKGFFLNHFFDFIYVICIDVLPTCLCTTCMPGMPLKLEGEIKLFGTGFTNGCVAMLVLEMVSGQVANVLNR